MARVAACMLVLNHASALFDLTVQFIHRIVENIADEKRSACTDRVVDGGPAEYSIAMSWNRGNTVVMKLRVEDMYPGKLSL